MPRDRNSPPEELIAVLSADFRVLARAAPGRPTVAPEKRRASCVFARPTIPTVSRGACWPPATEI